MNLQEAFAKVDDEFLKFDQIENPLHSRPDICAFLLLDKLVPEPGKDIITASEHDEFYLSTDCDKLAEVATEEDIKTLRRCGVMYDAEYHSLSMFT